MLNKRERACEGRGIDSGWVDLADGIGEATHNNVITIVIDHILRAREKTDRVPPDAGILGTELGVKKDLVAVTLRGGRVESLNDSRKDGIVLRTATGVMLDGPRAATGDEDLAGHDDGRN